MITDLSLTSVFVKDIDEAKAFYVDVLGLEPRDDIDLGDFRWCTVGHPSQPELHLHLTTPSPPYSPDVLQQPEDRPYGVEALIRDNSGNWVVLVEHRAFDPSTIRREDVDPNA